jgi:hypothetical protein
MLLCDYANDNFIIDEANNLEVSQGTNFIGNNNERCKSSVNLETSNVTVNNFVNVDKVRKFRLNTKEMLLPRCCWKRDQRNIDVELCEKLIEKKLGIENFLLVMNQFANMKSLLLDERQIEILNHLKKRKINEELTYYKIKSSYANTHGNAIHLSKISMK